MKHLKAFVILYWHILTTIVLMVLLLASACVGYEAAHSWNNPTLANFAFVFFSLFWVCILVLSLVDCPKDEISDSIEDSNYNSNNVNK